MQSIFSVFVRTQKYNVLHSRMLTPSKIKLFLIVLSVFAFSLPVLVSAQAPPGGTLSITVTAKDNVVIDQNAPSYVFWYLISGYPSPSNPWLPVATANGTGTGTTKVAAGNYGIFQQAENQDWRLISFSCSDGAGPTGDSLPELGIANVSIGDDGNTTCTVSNKYIATGELKIVVEQVVEHLTLNLEWSI